MTRTITDYADQIMTEIDGDIAEGVIPGSVASFADLHDYVDANDYLLNIGVPWGTDDPSGTDEIWNKVTDEITRRLSAPDRKHCTHGTCSYQQHDHEEVDESGEGKPKPMMCRDCHQPTHYDYKVDQYRHDNPQAAACFLVPARI